jgi:hypothetical protein
MKPAKSATERDRFHAAKQSNAMCKLLIAALTLTLFSASAAAAEEADFQNPETEIILPLQAAIRADDKGWFVAHLHFPVRYHGKTKHIIRSKDWFLCHYATIIGPELRASILAEDPEKYFKKLSRPHGR